jgi:hypothetical protein
MGLPAPPVMAMTNGIPISSLPPVTMKVCFVGVTLSTPVESMGFAYRLDTELFSIDGLDWDSVIDNNDEDSDLAFATDDEGLFVRFFLFFFALTVLTAI